MRFHSAILALAVLCLLVPVVATASLTPPEDEEVRVFIIGPAVVGVGQNVSYKVVVTGGPGENGGEFSYESELRGTNLTADALAPATASSDTTGIFMANMEAPVEAQTVEIYVKGFSARDTERRSAEATLKVQVIKPRVLTATVLNDGEVDVADVEVRFYVDGTLVDSTTVKALGVDETRIITGNWTVLDPSPGRHLAKVEVDTEGAGVVLVESGSAEYYREFYIEEDAAKYPWYIAFTVLAVALGVSAYLLRKSGYL